MKKTHLLWALLIVGAAVYVFTRGAGPEAEMRARLAEAEELLEKSSDEASLAAVDRASKLGGLLTEEFLVTIEPYGQSISSRRDLTRSFVGFRRAYRTIAVGLEAREIEVSGGQATSRVRATFFGTGGGGGPSREAWDTEIVWRDEGGWKMSEVTVIGPAEGLL